VTNAETSTKPPAKTVYKAPSPKPVPKKKKPQAPDIKIEW
jgi:hypothetical protein